jgi:hypothetical protein
MEESKDIPEGSLAGHTDATATSATGTKKQRLLCITTSDQETTGG